MPTDILRAYANERVDLVDFDFLADSGFQENLRQPMEEFFTDPAGQRAWILDGFTIANPSGDQVEVTKGRAILGQREGALVFYGALTVEGDATKIIDMTSLTPNANYGLYLRFEYVDGDTSSRIFWNPAGTGSEVAQAVATRRKANWSIRIELTNPGSEYLKIATLDNTGIGVAITDERPMYFEGEVHNSYQSGWSSDGGGAANDRNADRQQYGVKDFQTFTQAMRQCLEDIRGRGLRRWWERDIGGMNIGFDAAPVEDRLAVGDGNFHLYHDGTDPYLQWGADDYLWFDRSSNVQQLVIAGNPMLQIGTVGTRLTGLAVSDTLGVVPSDNRMRVGDTNFMMSWDGTDPYIYFDSTDYLFYDRSEDEYHFYVAGGKKLQIEDNGIRTRGIAVSNALTVAPAVNGVYVGDSTFYLGWDGTDPHINFDGILGVKDELWYDRSQNLLYLNIGGLSVWRGESTGTRSVGIAVSDTLGVTPTLDQIRCGVFDFRMEWDGTDPYLYWDTSGGASNDYFYYDRSANGLYLYIDSSPRTIFGAGGMQTRGLSISSALGVAVETDSLRVGDVDFKLHWDGTNPYLYFDDDDYIWYDISGTSIYAVIGTTDRVRIGTVGTRVQGLSVSSALGVTPVADQIRVGDASFRLRFDGTDPYLYFDNGDYFWFDRSAETLGELELVLNSTPRHAWSAKKAYMAGSGAIATDLTTKGEYTFDTVSSMLFIRDEDNAGSINTREIKGLSNLVHYDGGIVTAGVTTVNQEIKNFSLRGGTYVGKVLKFMASGEVYHSAGGVSFELWWSIGSFGAGSTVYKLTWNPDLVGAKDFWWTEMFVAIETSGAAISPRVMCRMSWHESEGAVDQGVRLVTGQPVNTINTANLLQIELYCGNPTTTGNFTVVTDMFVVEELYGAN